MTQALSQKEQKVLEALSENWQAEMRGFHTYNTLAERDDDAVRSKTLRHIAEAEAQHAAMWAKRIRDLGAELPKYDGKPTGDADTLVNRLGGPQMALRRLEIDESRDIARYGTQLKELGDEPSIVILNQVIADEQEHYRELSELIRHRYPKMPPVSSEMVRKELDELLTRRNHSGRQTAGWIGDAIYGVNDGLGAIFGIVSGVSGATLGNSHWVLLSGIAGMVASALSMGSGAYLAAKSEREIYEAELAREREAIEMNGPEAQELLSLYYQVKGIPRDDAGGRAAEHDGGGPEQAAGVGMVRGAVDGGGGVHPHRAVFLYDRLSGCDCVSDCVADCAFRGGRGEIADHGAVVVGERTGDDAGGRGGRRGDVCDRDWVGTTGSVDNPGSKNQDSGHLGWFRSTPLTA
jgi:rubrerythrin